MEPKMITENRIRVLALGLMMLAVALLIVFTMAKPAQAAFPGQNGKLVFARGGDVWTINPDGSALTNITRSASVESGPAFSPDGTMIAYSLSSGIAGIYIMNSDGSHARKVSGTFGYQLAWSPDGAKIAYVNNGVIYTMKANGTNVTRLTTGEAPDWSPNGTKIAFQKALASGWQEIFTVPASGGTPTRITFASDNRNSFPMVAPFGSAHSPSFSPDGTKIAFQSSDGNLEIFTVSASGGTPTQYTNDVTPRGYSVYPRFSSSGTSIAFVGGTGNSDDNIYIRDTRVPNTLGVTSFDWGPTGVPPLDKTAPQGTIKINGGDAYTRSASVKLSLGAYDPSPGNGLDKMRLMQDGGSWSAWMPYATSKSFTLTNANGTRTVNAQYRDWAGNVSKVALDRIVLDTVKPTISGMSPGHRSITRNTTPTIAATVKDSATNLSKSNIKLYVAGKRITRFSYSSATDRLTYTSPRLTKGKKAVKIVATDAAGNVGVVGVGAKPWYFTIR